MSLAILVPFRTDEGIRASIFDWTYNRSRHIFPDFKIYAGEPDEGPFNRSQAINNAFKQIGDEKFVFITDTDTILSKEILFDALKRVEHSGRWIIPYWNYMKLDQESSNKLMLQPYEQTIRMHDYTYTQVIQADVNDPFRPPLSGGILISVEDFRKVGGFDEGFVGWGYEDNAFAKMASHKLGNFERLGDNIYHIWHPQGTEITWDSPTLGANHYRFHLYNEDIESMKYDYL